jgi:hypothetical protein
MRLVVEAHRARAEARANLSKGDFAVATTCASAAQARCATTQGERLLILARWLAANSEKRGERLCPFFEKSSTAFSGGATLWPQRFCAQSKWTMSMA